MATKYTIIFLKNKTMYTKSIQVKVEPELKDKVHQDSKKIGLNSSSYIRHLIIKHYNKNG